MRHRCGYCREVGHNSRTCEKLIADMHNIRPTITDINEAESTITLDWPGVTSTAPFPVNAVAVNST